MTTTSAPRELGLLLVLLLLLTTGTSNRRKRGAMRPHQPWAGPNPDPQRRTLCTCPWWGAMHKPQPHTRNNHYDNACDRVDPGRSRVGGKPDSPCRHCHPDTEQEVDPLLPLGERQQRGKRDDADCNTTQPSVPARRGIRHKTENPRRQK